MVSSVAYLALDPTSYAVVGRRQFVAAGTYPITTNTTIMSDLVFDAGAVFSVSAGATLTLTGHIDAPSRQIFAGPGNVAFPVNSYCDTLRPEWWGAVADGTTDSTAAGTACLTSAQSGNKTVKLSGWYACNTGPWTAPGPGSIEVSGMGTMSSGFKVANPNGAIKFSGTGLVGGKFDVCNLHDFGGIAVGNNGVGVSRGDFIEAYWPAGSGDIEPTLICRNLHWRSDTYSSSEANEGYFTAGIHARQANMAHIENCHGVAIVNTTTNHIYCDNATANGFSCFGINISKCNFQGGYCANNITGEYEEVLIEPLGYDTQVICIIANTNGALSNSAGNDGVLTIRGGDLNGIQSCAQITSWRWIYIDHVDFGIFTPPGGTPSTMDVLAIYGSNIYSSYISISSCYLDASTQAYGQCLARFANVGFLIYSGNMHGVCQSGVIFQDGLNHVPGCTISNNVFTSQGATPGSVAIWIVAGTQCKVNDNNIQGYQTGILVQGTGCDVRDNLVTCTTPYNVSSGNKLISA